jgi:hypothetical protein
MERDLLTFVWGSRSAATLDQREGNSAHAPVLIPSSRIKHADACIFFIVATSGDTDHTAKNNQRHGYGKLEASDYR